MGDAMTFQTPPPGANSANEYLASSIPFLTSSAYLSASSVVEISFPYVASFVNVYNSSPTGSLAVAFSAPGIGTSAHFDVTAGSTELFNVRCTSVFLGASTGAPQSYSLNAGLTGIRVRDNNFYQYDPGDEGGLILNLDASVATSLFTNSTMTSNVVASGDPVGGWQDQSGQGNHLIQASTTLRGSYSSAGLLERPAVIFDGVDDYMSCVNQLNMASGTVFVVFKNITSVQYDGLLKITGSFTGTVNGRVFYTAGGTGVVYLANPSTSQFYTQFGTASTWSIANDSMNIMYSWGSTIASNIVRKNGSYLTNNGSFIGTGYTQPTTNNAYFPVGYLSNTANIAASQILAFNSQLSLGAIQRVEAYLKAKWGTP